MGPYWRGPSALSGPLNLLGTTAQGYLHFRFVIHPTGSSIAMSLSPVVAPPSWHTRMLAEAEAARAAVQHRQFLERKV